MVKALILGLMETNTLVNGRMIEDKGKALTLGMMEQQRQAFG